MLSLLPRLRSGLFIDFENLPLSPEALPNWLAWLEDGRFHHGRRRRLDLKRVYWNSAAERNRDRFEAQGFDVVLCEKYANRKNGADIRMAVDIVETVHTEPGIDEFILVTADSDFVPVLQRLQARGKRAVVLVDEERQDHHTICRRHASVLIPKRLLAEARQYQRGPTRLELLRQRLRARWAAASPVAAGQGPAMVERGAAVGLIAPRPANSLRQAQPAVTPAMIPVGMARPATLLRPEGGPHAGEETALERAVRDGDGEPTIVGDLAGGATVGRNGSGAVDQPGPMPLPQAAVERVVELAARRPRNFTGRGKIIAALTRVPGFTQVGRNRFFGHDSYQALMLEVARRDPRIAVIDTDGGGIGVKFLPDSGCAASELPGPSQPVARSGDEGGAEPPAAHERPIELPTLPEAMPAEATAEPVAAPIAAMPRAAVAKRAADAPPLRIVSSDR